MRNFNKNAVVMIAAFLIIGAGFPSKTFVSSIKEAVWLFLMDDNTISEKVGNLINDIETASTQNLSYSNVCIEINSVGYKLTDCRTVNKGNTTVVKMDNGYLAYAYPRVDDEILKSFADNCAKLKQTADEQGIPFVYVMAPEKGENGKFPVGAKNNIKDNCDRFASLLQERGIELLNLRDKKDEQGISEEEMFFITDHHWKPKSGLWATKEILEKFKTDYGFAYDEKVTDISNYNVKTYKDYFLGSQGKKVGQYFTELGLDDIDLITPNFQTSLKSEIPFSDEITEGDFCDTVMRLNNLEIKDFYKKRAYSVYSKGDIALHIVKNNLAPEKGKTYIVIRDSFAGVVTPFLSLAVKSVHAIDLREFDGNRIQSVSKYIEEIKPDGIIVLYTSVESGDIAKFDFR